MTQPFRTILCPVYFDETSPAALQYARYFARQGDGVVHLLHTVPTDELHLLRRVYRPEEGGGANVDWAEQVAKERLEAIAREQLGGVRCDIVLRRSSDPATGILEVEKELNADLLVMATHGRTGLSHLLLGSVAEKVVRESRCPVFTTRLGEELSETEPLRTILVPVDIAERSAPVLMCARRIAEQCGSTVYPLHIVPTDETDLLLRDVYQAREGVHANLVVAERVARQKLKDLAQDYLEGVPYEPILYVSSDPAKTILEVASDVGAHLLVMATHGFTGVFHLLLGSLTEKMMREAHCPVLAFRQPAAVPYPQPNAAS
jgi:nucleotide-binding universal stress UspA family protein